MDQKVKYMDAKIQKVLIIVECLYEHIYGEEMMFQEISDNSSANPHSSSGEDSATDNTSIASADCDDSTSVAGKQGHTDSMPSHTKAFTVLMSDKSVSSDSDGGYAIAAIQESHVTTSASYEEISRGAKKAIPRANEQKLHSESQREIQEFIAVHSKITRKYRNCKEDNIQ